MDPLLDAVDDLTRPKPVKVDTDNGPTWATEDALLVQLEEAIRSTMNSGSGAGGSPWTRNVLDSAALHQAAVINSQIGDWCRMAGLTATRDAVTDLRAWYANRLSVSPHEREASDAWYLDQMTAWAGQIRAMVNPPKTIEITAPCPLCGEGTYTNDIGERVTNPVIVQYRPETGSIWQDAKALCRACEHVWSGEWELRALRHDVDAHDTAV